MNCVSGFQGQKKFCQCSERFANSDGKKKTIYAAVFLPVTLWSGEEPSWRAQPTCSKRLLALTVHQFPSVLFVNVNFYRYLAFTLFWFFFFLWMFPAHLRGTWNQRVRKERLGKKKCRRLYLFLCVFLDWWCARSLRLLLLGRRDSRCKQAFMGEIWCFETLVLFFETFETRQSTREDSLPFSPFPEKKIGRIIFSQREKRRRNQHGSQISCVAATHFNLCPHLGRETNFLLQSNLKWRSKTSQFFSRRQRTLP